MKMVPGKTDAPETMKKGIGIPQEGQAVPATTYPMRPGGRVEVPYLDYFYGMPIWCQSRMPPSGIF